MKKLLQLLTLLLPWFLRRKTLQWWFGFEIHPTARIGLAWIFPAKLVMEADARIDHFTVAVNLEKIVLKNKAKIGRGNWITGFPRGKNSLHFQHQANRQPELIMSESSAITKNHHLDCTDRISIGKFTTIAGYNSQLLTHSIDVLMNRQDSSPITIGEYCFVGTNVVVLGGATLPARSVLGAKSLLNKSFTEEWKLYGGVPAKMIADIPRDAGYFMRTDGFVY
jgi:acetyltransferase-like isoleucine patch superfamily enzyme